MLIEAINQNLSNKQVIFINDLMLQVIIGTSEWERQVARSLTINIAITMIPVNENITKQHFLSDFNYKDLVNLILDFSSNNNFETLEEMAIKLENLIVDNYKSNKMFNLKIEIKMPFPLKNVKEIGTSIERTYSNS